MIILDTNVISEIGKLKPDPNVRDWVDRHRLEDLYLCAPVVSELAFGARRIVLRDGSDRFERVLDQLIGVTFANRILSFDTEAAIIAGAMRAERQAKGSPAPVIDLEIAAICRVHGISLATRNRKDFEDLGIELIDPFASVA